MSESSIVELVTSNKSDEERAKEFRDRIIAAHAPILEILNEITAAGLVCNYQTTLTGVPPRHQVASINILKVLSS